MSENGKSQRKKSFEDNTENHNKSKDYQILIGDNSLCDSNLSQQHLSQSQTTSTRSRSTSYDDSTTTAEYRPNRMNAFQNYISDPHHFLLVLFSVIYVLLVLLGASVFALFEQKAEFALREHILRVQHNFLTDHPCIDAKSLDEFLSQVLKAYDNGVNLNLLNKIIRQKESLTNDVSPLNTDSISDSSTATPTTTPTTTQRLRNFFDKNKGNVESNSMKANENKAKSNPPFKTPTEFSNWEFTSSLVFVTSVVTTIGYGHVTPITVEGKVFCLVFSCVSIPFTLVFLSIFVSLLKNGPVKKFENCLIRTITKRFKSTPVFFIRILHVIIVTLILLILILIIPALVFSHVEKEWTFLDSIYYCYISLTTVGLGDFVASTNHLLYSSYLQFYRICIVFYLYAGLGLIMLWIAVILRIPQLNLKPFLLTEKEETDERTHIIDYKESPPTYGTQRFFP